MAWIVHDGHVLASCVTVEPGKIGIVPVGELLGAQIITGRRWLCTGRVGADLAFCDVNQTVVELKMLGKWRIAGSPQGATTVVVGESGALERWQLAVGDRLAITE